MDRLERGFRATTARADTTRAGRAEGTFPLYRNVPLTVAKSHGIQGCSNRTLWACCSINSVTDARRRAATGGPRNRE